MFVKKKTNRFHPCNCCFGLDYFGTSNLYVVRQFLSVSRTGIVDHHLKSGATISIFKAKCSMMGWWFLVVHGFPFFDMMVCSCRKVCPFDFVGDQFHKRAFQNIKVARGAR